MNTIITGEFRGVAKRQSTKGNDYVIVSGEDNEGTSFSIFSKNTSIASGLVKGDSCTFRALLEVGSQYTKFELLEIEKL